MKHLFDQANLLFQQSDKSQEALAYFMTLSQILACLEANSLPVPELEGSYSENISLEWRNETDEFILLLKSKNKIIYSGILKSNVTICGIEVTSKNEPISKTIEGLIRLFSEFE